MREPAQSEFPEIRLHNPDMWLNAALVFQPEALLRGPHLSLTAYRILFSEDELCSPLLTEHAEAV
jgi:hypothetical protein